MAPPREDRFVGCLLGLACGDAVGTTVEFRPRDSFEPLTDMVGGGPFHLAPGQWTDDTSLALCLADSLIARGGFDPRDQMERYVRWARDGERSSTGACFDIGSTTHAALTQFERTGEPFSGSTDPQAAGNGSLMRLAPVPMRWADDPAEAVRLAGESSRTTHGATEAVDACRAYAEFLTRALAGADRDAVLAPFDTPADGAPLAPAVAAITRGSYQDKTRDAIRSSGYVVHSLEAALWSFATTRTFRDAILTAANLGHDADTTAAIAGQLAGAHYGAGAIPESWRATVALGDEIAGLARALMPD